MYQSQFPRPPSETLPTMYDLPSEDPEEFGLPDEFHDFQPKLLRETCKPKTYLPSEYFIGTDINLYYDSRNTRWYKRPDWFLALGVSIGDQQEDMRWSYVVWQEGISPFLVVELLSPGTENEDLGRNIREIGKPPIKWEVYERMLRIPFYVVFDRYENQLRVFSLDGGRYCQENLGDESRVWFDELELGLGVWQGIYQGFEGKWLRWYEASGEWIPTDAEARQQAETQAESERSARQQAETQVENERSARQQAETQAESERSARAETEAKLTAAILPLISLGLTVEQIANSLGLTVERVNQEL